MDTVHVQDSGGAGRSSAPREGNEEVGERLFLRHSILKVIILSRQARDKHRESTRKRVAVSYRERRGKKGRRGKAKGSE